MLTLKKVALTEPLLVGRLVSKTSHVAGINITIELPGKNEITEGPEVVNYARGMMEDFEQKHPEIDVYNTGIVMMNNAFPEASIKDMQTLIPFAFAAIIIGLLLFLRSITGTVTIFFVIIFSIITGMGTCRLDGF